MTDQQKAIRPLAEVEAEITAKQAERDRLDREYQRALTQIGEGYGGDTTAAEAEAQRLLIMTSALDNRLRALEQERYAATKADVLEGYRAVRTTSKTATEASRTARQQREALEADMKERLKQAGIEAGNAQNEAQDAKRIADAYVRQRAAASGYGDRLVSEIAEAVWAVDREFNVPNPRDGEMRAAALRQQREQERAEAEAERQRKHDENWERYYETHGKPKGEQ